MNYKDSHAFMEDYQAFLQINALLYHPSTCPFTEPTPLYEELIEDLLLHIETMKTKERIEIEQTYAHMGTIQHMQTLLLEQLDRLEEPYEIQIHASQN